ncbi:formin-like protein 18 [Coffea eugenioides]|uniref:formin-like protein 18 n=1 Tax=Coffea eugenioides TaxID=49369 RepID=UPI000F60602C|nr:formin-like protein 18 [Coffea eugenioides]
MALFRKFFYRKPPEGLWEISERVYVFDCCFAVDALRHDEYREYVRCVVAQLRDYYPDGSFVVFNFCDGENHGQIANILSVYDIIVMDYPKQYGNCPLLTMEMIHHFLKSSESWLAGHRNVLLLHCEYGGWPLLAFMLASFLVYSKQYTGEHRTLGMIYKQAPRELLQLLLPLNPLPSQLRYIQYISKRKLGSEWPPFDRVLVLDRIILRNTPTMGEEGGCCPTFRIYRLDPLISADQNSKVLFSGTKRSDVIPHKQQADSKMVKIDINCHIQGDVVLECITIKNDLQFEDVLFRIMFNTAFIQSNILILNHDEIDTPWNVQHHFSRDFRAEVLFLEMDSSPTLIPHDYPTTEDKGSLPSEAFGNMFRNVESLEQKADVDQHHAGNENLGQGCMQSARIVKRSCHETAKEENQGTLPLPSNGHENLKSVPANASQVQKMFSRVNLLHLKNDVELNMLKTTASDSLQENLETSPFDGKEKLNARSPQCASVEILENIAHESAKDDTPETTSLSHAGNENLVDISPKHVLEGTVMGKPSSDSISDMPNSKALGSEIRSSLPELLEERCPESSTSLGLNALTKKMDSQEIQGAFERPVQNKMVLPTVFHGSLPNPASNCLQGSPLPLTKYTNASSVLGITALLHDTSSNNKMKSHMVTISPRSALSASFPQLCKPVTTSLLQVVPPSDLPSSTVATSNLAKVSATPFLSSSPQSSPSLPKAHPTLSNLSSESSIDDLSAPNEQDFRKKSDCVVPTRNTGCLPSVSHTPLSTLAHPEMPLSSSSSNVFPPPPPPPPPPLFPRMATSLFVKNSFTCAYLPPSSPPFSFSSALTPDENTKNSSEVASSLPEVALSGGLVPSKLQDKSTTNETIPLTPPPPNLFVSSDSSIAAISSASPPIPPSPPPPPPTPPSPPPSASVEGQTPCPTTMYSSLTPTPLTAPLPGSNSSSGLISLIVPENKLEKSAFSPPPLHSGLIASAAVSSAGQLPAHQSSPPPSSSIREASTPIQNPSSSSPLAQPPVPEAASFSDSISSLVPEKSNVISARLASPPPPLHSKALSNPAAVSAPAPPPPPSFSSNKLMAKISPHVPPPPAPFSNTLPKTGTTLQSHSSGRNGRIPPTPASPLGSKGRLQASSSAKYQNKKSSLKPYHWLKLTRATQGSLWAETQKPEEASKTPEFDMSEIESLFSVTVQNLDDGSTKGKSSRASRSKSDKVNLIDLRRAYNCEIMLTKVKIPLPDLMSSVLTLDDSALDVDQVDNLIKFCPTKEEMELIKNYKGDKENLGKCEQYFLELMKVPRVESKLRVFSFKIQFSSQVSDLRNALNIVNSASEEVRKSVKLKRVMQAILSLGNALNQGTARGSAVGFRLDSLLKLTDTRARNKKMTLMHYLCKVLNEKLPELLEFPKDLTSLEAANKIQLKYLAEEMQSISKGLEKVVHELTASANDGPVSESFCKMLKEFLCSAEAEVRSLASLYSGVGKNADTLAHYFGEDPARCPFEQVVSTLLNFVRMFERAHEENCKQIEFEKKRAEKNADIEKTNLSAFLKE